MFEKRLIVLLTFLRYFQNSNLNQALSYHKSLLNHTFYPIAINEKCVSIFHGGGGRIRTHGAHHTTVFKTATLNHSVTPPNQMRNSECRFRNFLFHIPQSALRIYVIFSSPPIYPLSASGIITVPSSC